MLNRKWRSPKHFFVVKQKVLHISHKKIEIRNYNKTRRRWLSYRTQWKEMKSLQNKRTLLILLINHGFPVALYLWIDKATFCIKSMSNHFYCMHSCAFLRELLVNNKSESSWLNFYTNFTLTYIPRFCATFPGALL